MDYFSVVLYDLLHLSSGLFFFFLIYQHFSPFHQPKEWHPQRNVENCYLTSPQFIPCFTFSLTNLFISLSVCFRLIQQSSSWYFIRLDSVPVQTWDWGNGKWKRNIVEEKLGLAPPSQLKDHESLLLLFILVAGWWRGNLTILKPRPRAPPLILLLPKTEFANIFGLIYKGDWNFCKSSSSFLRAYAYSRG